MDKLLEEFTTFHIPCAEDYVLLQVESRRKVLSANERFDKFYEKYGDCCACRVTFASSITVIPS